MPSDTNNFTPFVGSDPINSTTLNSKMAELSGGITEAAVDILITASDTTEKEYLDDAFSDGGDIAFAVASPGGNETLQATINAGAVGSAELAADSVGAAEIDEAATITVAALFVDGDDLDISGAVETFRNLAFSTGATRRFALTVNNDPETGGGTNAGSNYRLNAFTDGGGFLGNVESIERATQNVTFTKSVTVLEDFSVTGTKAFRDTHPIREGYSIVHVAAESPRNELIYRGKVQLENGRAVVNIDTDCNEAGGMTPGTFEAITRNPDIFLQNQTGFARVRPTLDGATLTIEADDVTSTDTVSWQVIAERVSETLNGLASTDAAGRLICEPENPPLDIAAVQAELATIETMRPDGTLDENGKPNMVAKDPESLKQERLRMWKQLVRGKGKYPFAGPIKHPQTRREVEVIPPGWDK